MIVGRDASFSRALHKGTAEADTAEHLKKDKEAQRAAVDEYFQHWDNKEAQDETRQRQRGDCRAL